MKKNKGRKKKQRINVQRLKSERKKIKPEYHFVGNIEHYYQDKKVTLWVRILTYLIIFQMENGRDIYVSDKYLANKFNAPIPSVKYSMRIIRKQGFAIYDTYANEGNKGKTRNIFLCTDRIKQLLNVFEWNQPSANRYEKKFIRQRVISYYFANKNKEKQSKEYFRFLFRQEKYKKMEKHIGVSAATKDYWCEKLKYEMNYFRHHFNPKDSYFYARNVIRSLAKFERERLYSCLKLETVNLEHGILIEFDKIMNKHTFSKYKLRIVEVLINELSGDYRSPSLDFKLSLTSLSVDKGPFSFKLA